MQNKLFLKAADICEILEVKQTSAYEIISNLNKELAEQGYLTLSIQNRYTLYCDRSCPGVSENL